MRRAYLGWLRERLVERGTAPWARLANPGGKILIKAENEPAAFPLTPDVVFPIVGIVASYAGADEMPIRSFVNAGAKGIVVSALAGWSVSSAQEEAIAEAACKGVIVVMSSRTGSGCIVLEDRVKWKTVLNEGLPAIGAGTLNPQKARILLMLALTRFTIRRN
jgi:L-asparaginase